MPYLHKKYRILESFETNQSSLSKQDGCLYIDITFRELHSDKITLSSTVRTEFQELTRVVNNSCKFIDNYE